MQVEMEAIMNLTRRHKGRKLHFVARCPVLKLPLSIDESNNNNNYILGIRIIEYAINMI